MILHQMKMKRIKIEEEKEKERKKQERIEQRKLPKIKQFKCSPCDMTFPNKVTCLKPADKFQIEKKIIYI